MSQDSSDEAQVDTPQQWRPTKPTDAETKAEIRKVFEQAAAENNITDEARIEDAVEEMFVMMKKSFG
jgi:hypothetical protein